MTFGEWVESLPLDPSESEDVEAGVWHRRGRHWLEDAA